MKGYGYRKMKADGNVTLYEDFKYVLADVSSIYLGAKFSYEELLNQEMVPFKLKAIVTQYILKEASPDTTLESQFYYLEEGAFLFEIFKQLKIRVKAQVQVERKNLLGKGKTEYQERIFTLEELAAISPAGKKALGMLVREIVISKLGMMTFSV